MDRRNFMALILAASAAPAIVRAGSIMRINPRIVAPPSGISIFHGGWEFKLKPVGFPGVNGWQLHADISACGNYTASAWIRPGPTPLMTHVGIYRSDQIVGFAPSEYPGMVVRQ